jgi:hypothetical protein
MYLAIFAVKILLRARKGGHAHVNVVLSPVVAFCQITTR